MEVKVVKGVIVLLGACMLDGELVLETTCRDYDHFVSLPDVVEYGGTLCGKTGWSSDTNRACYKSGAMLAYVCTHVHVGENRRTYRTPGTRAVSR